ncbi:MAG: hypothetical protein HQ472_08830 [Ignavibacteria bacterium]|nr:hypothetical protein [Ignavibacteria bacterium]
MLLIIFEKFALLEIVLLCLASTPTNVFAQKTHAQVTYLSGIEIAGVNLVTACNEALIIASQNTLLRSYNKGKDWLPLCPPLRNKNVVSIVSNADTILVLSNTGTLAFTTNLGLSWKTLDALENTDGLSSIQRKKNMIVGLTQSGKPVTSTNWGNSWSVVKGAKRFSAIAFCGDELVGQDAEGEIWWDVLGKQKSLFKKHSVRKSKLLCDSQYVIVMIDDTVCVYNTNGNYSQYGLNSWAWSGAGLENDKLWVGYHRGGLEWVNLKIGEAGMTKIDEASDGVITQVEPRNGVIYLGINGEQGGLFKYEPNSGAVLRVPPMLTTSGIDIATVLIESARVLVGSRDNGCYYADFDGRALVPISSGIDYSAVASIFEAQGHWWFVSRILGLYVLKDCSGELVRAPLPTRNGNEFFAAVSDKKVILSVDDNVVYSTTNLGETWVKQNSPVESSYMVMQMESSSDGQALISTSKGLFQTSDAASTWNRYASSVDSTQAEWAVKTARGIYYAARGELFLIGPTGETRRVDFDDDMSTKKYCFDINEIEGNVIASASAGLYVLSVKSKSWKFIPIADAKFIRKTALYDDQLLFITDAGKIGVIKWSDVTD